MAVGDFNRDGKLDLAVAAGSSGVSILLQTLTVSLSTTGLTFAGELVGTPSAPQTVTLTNTGSAPVNALGVAVTGANAADFGQTNTCTSLSPGASCTIIVTFTPTQIGLRKASLAITYEGPGSPQFVALSGTGVVSGPNATLSPTSLLFSPRALGSSTGGSPVTLANFGTATLAITNILITGADAGDFAQTNTCGG